MDSTQERQDLEITALRSIYEENFFETPPPKAWKVRGFGVAMEVSGPEEHQRAQHGCQNLPSG